MKLTPKTSIASGDFIRPDWTTVEVRSPERLWLNKNENNDPILAKFLRGILQQLPEHILYTYAELSSLYHKLAEHLGVDAKNLYFSAGSDGAIRSVFEAYISPGDIVVHTAPTFAMYAVYSRMYEAKQVPLEYRYTTNGPSLEFERLVETIKQVKPKLVCIPNPDSPTGTVLLEQEVKELLRVTESMGSLLLLDEAYYPFYDKTALPFINNNAHLVITRTTAKAWGMAGCRLGFAIASEEVAKNLHKVKPMYEASHLAVAMMENMLDHYGEVLASVQRLQEGKRYFIDKMIAIGFTSYKSYGNFFHINFSGEHEDKVHKVLSDNMYYKKCFGEICLQGYSRISATTKEKFVSVVKEIEAIV